MHLWKVVYQAGIEVQPDIGVARTLITLRVVRILLDREGRALAGSRRTAAVYGIGVNAVGPGEVKHGVQPMPIALTVGCLQGVIARVAIVGQLDDVRKVGHAIQLEYRIKRARAIQTTRVSSTMWRSC